MANIGFTSKQAHVYDRFQKMRRDYEDQHGRTYAPDFLTVLMDAWETADEAINVASRKGTLIEFTTMTSYATNAEAKEPLFLEKQPKRKKKDQ